MPEATLLAVFLAGLLDGGIVGILFAGATILGALSFVPVWLAFLSPRLGGRDRLPADNHRETPVRVM